MLDKNNSVLWDEYRRGKHNHHYEDKAVQQFMLGLSMCAAIEEFIKQHDGFNGESELFAIRGMVIPGDEKYQLYAATYNNDIESVMRIVRPKIKAILVRNAVDPMALILYAMTGMFLELTPEESNEIHHILLTLLQYETMGIDVSGCKALWGHFAYTLDFESGYDAAQMDGKEAKPITYEEKRFSAGFLTESAQNTVAEFVFMNMSNLDKDWMQLFYENPVLATGIISLKQGISEEIWKIISQEDNGESNMRPYETYRRLITSDVDKAINGLTNATLAIVHAYGGSFIKYLLLADLICMKICDGKTVDGPLRELLDICIENLENTNTFSEGVTLEDILYGFHRESNLPELYILFFTVFYATDYGKFRSIAKNMHSKYC